MPKRCPYGPAFVSFTVSGILILFGVTLIVTGMQPDSTGNRSDNLQFFGCLIAAVGVLAACVSGICWQIVYAVEHLTAFGMYSSADSQSPMRAAPPESGRI